MFLLSCKHEVTSKGHAQGKVMGIRMRKEEVIRRLTDHRQELVQFGVKSLALFGSVVRDETRPTGDVDLLVEFQDRATFDQYMELKFYLEQLLGCRVDLVTRKGLKPRLRPVVEEGALYVT
jgi:predicted nucleotidyltransferase